MLRAQTAAGLTLTLMLILCGGCSAPARRSPPAATQPAARSGAYYENDGPGANPPVNLALTPDAVPRAEPPHKFANQPYTVLGKTYVPAALSPGARLTGRASWYGRKFHGSRTASGEVYDMYAMTAAHPTLPIPSYARVTSLQNARSVVVRVNDRGPFLRERLIDLSYTAALKLGFVEQGGAWVEVEPIVFALAAGATVAAAAPVPDLGSVSGPTATHSRTGHFVQLGAFRSSASAQSFHSRAAAQLDWIGALLHIAESGGLLRVRAGPYRSANEASAVAQRITRATGFSPVLTRF